MPEKPEIESLSHKHRKRLFVTLVVVFLIALPVMIFYTAGYRVDLGNDEQTIVTTGGMYITADNLEVDVYLDDEQVERPRVFRSAYYIQNIAAGQHRLVVQRPDLQTWVKVLPVDPHIVIEASAFNMPLIPHIRPITQYVTATGIPVYLGVATSTDLFGEATTTVPIIATSSKRVAMYTQNEEFIFVKSLFSTTSTSSQSVFERFLDGVDRFGFATSSALDTGHATTTEPIIERGDVRLVERGNELYATWLGGTNLPYYFCVTGGATASTTAIRYGQHVADEIERLTLSTTTPLIMDGDRLCRREIKLDRLRKDVYYYNFFPDSSDLVLLQLEDGLYVTEIDDRSWQNVQRIYSGNNFQVVIENATIYIHDGEKYFELITEIEPI